MSDYDAFAHEFSATRQEAWPEFELLLPFLKKGGRVLDLGCGNGRLRGFLDAQGTRDEGQGTKKTIPDGNYFGMDISSELLRIAQKEFPRDHFFRGDFSRVFPFGGDTFDLIVAIASFHHLLSKQDQLKFLQECSRVLKSGGILFLTTWKLPKKFFWKNVLHGRLKNWIIPFGREKHPRIYRRTSEEELARLLKKTGFTVFSSSLFRSRNYIAIGKKK